MPFGSYALYYDLLYRDKDYAVEAEYVARTIRSVIPDARSILELGSGTGRHGHLLAAEGFIVRGIERSPDMVALARSASGPLAAKTVNSFSCDVGDARSVRLEASFDAVIALFHVVSYQTTDADLQATFATAAIHLRPGGVFLFDVWHGPAVLAQRPEQRVKKTSEDDLEIIRTARPKLDTDRNTVKVTYDIECRNRRSGQITCFSEDHFVRYLFPIEIERFAAQSDMQLMASEELTTGRRPSDETWSVSYLLRKYQ
jgi:SAM-dependent methyltransferase